MCHELENEYHSPFGILTIFYNDQGITRINFPIKEDNKRESNLHNNIHKNHVKTNKTSIKATGEKTKLLNSLISQLDQYFAGNRKVFTLSYIIKGTDFQRKVWRELIQIPYGETRTYGEIAEQIGNPLAFRAVGGACNQNPIPIIIPCHRIIGANGKLTGFGGGLKVKKWLLNHENSRMR